MKYMGRKVLLNCRSKNLTEPQIKAAREVGIKEIIHLRELNTELFNQLISCSPDSKLVDELMCFCRELLKKEEISELYVWLPDSPYLAFYIAHQLGGERELSWSHEVPYLSHWGIAIRTKFIFWNEEESKFDIFW